MKKIALPVLNGLFSSHFGGAEGFAVFDIEEDSKTIGDMVFHQAPEHALGSFPGWLAGQGVDIVIAAGMGPRAVQMLQANGIEVVLGASGREPEGLVKAYLDGTLSASGESCNDHGHHAHGSGHSHHSGGGGCSH